MCKIAQNMILFACPPSVALLAKTRCVAWALENVPGPLRKYEGVYPTSRVYQMNEYYEIGQSRKRMILSNIALNYPSILGRMPQPEISLVK